MKIELLMVIINLILMLSAVGVLIKLIVRTEKGLDLAFKVLIVSPIVLSLASLLQMDKLIGAFSRENAQMIFYASRFIANVSFLVAVWILLRTVTKEER